MKLPYVFPASPTPHRMYPRAAERAGSLGCDVGLQPGHPADPSGQLFPMPRAGCEQAEGGTAAGYAGRRGGQGGVGGDRGGAGQAGGERAGGADFFHGQGRADAAGKGESHADGGAEGGAEKVGRGGRGVSGALGVRGTGAGGAAGGETRGLGAESDRSVRAREDRGRRLAAFAGGGSPDADPPADARSHGLAADAGGGGCVRGGHEAGCL